MHYRDLRDFIAALEARGELKRVGQPVSPRLEMTDLCDRTLRAEGPALLFEAPQTGNTRYAYPVLGNLFGTPRRVALGMGADNVSALREIGELAHIQAETRFTPRVAAPLAGAGPNG